jgi:hypothetical protein
MWKLPPTIKRSDGVIYHEYPLTENGKALRVALVAHRPVPSGSACPSRPSD